MQAAEHNFSVERGDDETFALTHETNGLPDAAAIAGSVWVLFITIAGQNPIRIETAPQGADIIFTLSSTHTTRLPANQPVPYRVVRVLDAISETWVKGTITGLGEGYDL